MGISFSGIFSGISTDELVSALVNLRRGPITQLENEAELRYYEKTAFQLVNDRVLDVKSALLNLRLESTFRTKNAVSSLPGLLGATAGFGAVPASHSVTIQSIARAAQAVSGLNDRALERASVKMANGNTAGIATLAMTANEFGGTRALSDTLLTDTLQAGSGSTEVTSGDRIQIDVTLKDTSTNTVYFDFASDTSDTMERLRQTIQAAFQGEAQVSIDSNGAFLITETDTSGVNTIALDTLTFIDSDYSGSTFTFTTGNTTAGNSATARTIVGTRTFTTGNSANIADGTEILINLDQFSGGALTGDETIEISGTQYDGDAVSSSFAVTATTTLNDLITELETLFNDGSNPPWETTVSIENGKIVFEDQSTGSSETAISMYFDDPTGDLNLNTGTFVMVDAGQDDISQTIRTSGFEVQATGKHLVSSTEGRGGVITGTVSMDADTILDSLGVSITSLFTVDRDDGSGVVDPVTIFGITEQSTVQDLVDAINGQVPGVTAQLVDDGAGASYFQILASQGGVDIRITDANSPNSILEQIFDPDAGVDFDISTLSDSGLTAVDAATTVATDFTLTTIYTPENGGPVQIRTVVGTDGDTVDDLIANVELQGSGGAFSEGDALIYTDKSSELLVSPPTSGYLLGIRNISDPSNTSTPPANIYTYIENSGVEIEVTSGTFTINGVEITIDNTSTQTLDEIMGLVNSSGAGVVMQYDDINDRFFIYRPDVGNTSPITIGAAGDTSNFITALGLSTDAGAIQFSGTAEGSINPDSALSFANFTIPMVSGTFTINGVKITANTSVDSLSDIIERINNSSAGVTASYDSNRDRLVLVQDLETPPLYNKITIGSATDTSSFWVSMRMTDTYLVPQEIGSAREKAQLTVDGITYIRDTNSIDDVINDVELSVRGVTTDPIAIDVTADTQRATEAIRDFVVEYNILQESINAKALTEDEHDALAKLTDGQRNSLTFTEIDNYEIQRQELNIQNVLYSSTILSRLDSALKLNTFSPVLSMEDDEMQLLYDLGISTGRVGLGVDLAKSSFLVTDSTDPELILQRLEENHTLQQALENDPEEVLALFGNDVSSEVTITGTKDLTYGITLADTMTFSLNDGTNQATVEFEPGFYPASQVISTITNSLAVAGFASSIRVYMTTGGFLQLVGETESGRARVSIQDLGGGENIANVLGMASQSATGVDALQNAGYARRLDAFFDGYTGTGGLIREKIRSGGLIDSELLRLASRIDDYEYRLELYEARLRSQFVAMELAMSQWETTSAFLAQQMGTSSSSDSGGGIPLSV